MARRYHAYPRRSPRRRSNLRTRGKGQGTSLGIDLMSRPSPCRSARARARKQRWHVYYLKINATREETRESTTYSVKWWLVDYTCECDCLLRHKRRALVSFGRKFLAEATDETMDPTGKSVQRTGRSADTEEDSSLGMSRFAINGDRRPIYRMHLPRERENARAARHLLFPLKLRDRAPVHRWFSGPCVTCVYRAWRTRMREPEIR